MIIHYTAVEKSFIVIVYRLLVQEKCLEILESHVVDCFKINDQQSIKMHSKGEYVRLKHYERKIKSDIESILVPEDN